jgi:hypothetical protein
VGFLDWLFGKKDRAVPANPPQSADPAPAAGTPFAGKKPTAPPIPEAEKPPSEAENLRRWRESGQPRAWVEARQGHWGHADWLALLEELQRSPYWPMPPDAVGLALEDARREWLRRN